MSFFDKLKGEVNKQVDKVDKYVHQHHGLDATVEQGLHGAKLEVEGAIKRDREEDNPKDRRRDKLRQDICRSHRFGSFAQPRYNNTVKWFVDGHDYFYAVSEMLSEATQSIFILDWWLSPELYLRRPPSDFPDWRLDRLLKRKAEEGVKVYIIVYKEVTETMSMGSKHTKAALEALHPNIRVMRHPDHIGSINSVEFWSHHEKLFVVDNHRACVGGLDLCFGRWDMHQHPLADAHPTEFSRTLFAGQDYNNGRVLDFQNVDNYVSNQVSILETARMPWHDLHVNIGGEAVRDLAQHFVERWNKVKREKYAKDNTYAWLAFAPDVEAYPNEAFARHPTTSRMEGTEVTQFMHPLEEALPSTSDPNDDSQVTALWGFQPPRDAIPDSYQDPEPMTGGSCNVQVVRSVSRWSHNLPTESSIQNAYIDLIQNAQHFIYIENQFFISNPTDKGPVVNKIAKALLERILVAARAGVNFKVIVVVPEVPGFAGDIQQTDAIKTIMAAQWRTINRGGNSIYELVRAAGYDPRDYIRFYHLRVYDRINAPKSFLDTMTKNSGKTFFEAQVGQACLFIGEDGSVEWKTKSIKINAPSDYGPAENDNLGTTQKKGTQVVQEVPYPQSCDDAAQTIKQFESGADRSDEEVSDSVAQHILSDTTDLKDEQWLGTEEEEKDCYVTELCYIHSKVMIVDDMRVVIGSANLNDRSQKGDGDSEIALVIEDTDMIDSMMDGQPYQAARFAATFRRQIMKEHLGLVEAQQCTSSQDPITSFMHAVPYPSDDQTESQEDQMVQDPLSDEFFNQLWDTTATRNRQIFSEIWKTVPSDVVRSWAQYKTFMPNVKTGHVDSPLPIAQIKEKLSSIKGALVSAPLDFLIEEKSLTNDENPNWLGLNPTLPVYI